MSRWSMPKPAGCGRAEGAEGEEGEADAQSVTPEAGMMGVAERMKAAMKGSKAERSILIRDPNKLVSASVLSSPKLTESEVENFAKMANVSEEVLRIIGMNRGVDQELRRHRGADAGTRRRRLAVSMRFVQRLNDRDLKMIALDRNLQEPLKLAVRKRIYRRPREEMIRMLSADDKLAEIKRLYYQTIARHDQSRTLPRRSIC